MNTVYNVAAGQRTTLNMLHSLLADALRRTRTDLVVAAPHHADFRPRRCAPFLADVGKAARLSGYRPTHDLGAGLVEAAPWYVRRFQSSSDTSTAPGRAIGHAQRSHGPARMNSR